jgi:hypothetical protein
MLTTGHHVYRADAADTIPSKRAVVVWESIALNKVTSHYHDFAYRDDVSPVTWGTEFDGDTMPYGRIGGESVAWTLDEFLHYAMWLLTRAELDRRIHDALMKEITARYAGGRVIQWNDYYGYQWHRSKPLGAKITWSK